MIFKTVFAALTRRGWVRFLHASATTNLRLPGLTPTKALLHFGKDHAFRVENERRDAPLLFWLDQDLKKTLGDFQPAAIIISGDLTSIGTKEEFDEVLNLWIVLKVLLGCLPPTS